MQKYQTSPEWIKQAVQEVISKIEDDIERFTITSKDTTSAIFLAWAPWSGKTEFILSLKTKKYFFIDIDSYRNYFIWYEGNNSQDFQKAISGVVDGVTKYCFKNDIRFILDGTFKSLVHVKRNIENCKKKKRKIKIYFIFQNPYVSYYYTFLRKLNDERHIPAEWFVECFYESIRNIFIAKWKDKNIELSICEKNNFLEKVITEKDYRVRNDIDEITKFCKFYWIWYNDDQFSNRDILSDWIKWFDNLLNSYRLLVKFHGKFLDLKKKIWQKKKKNL